jgi:serine/threonine protein kinase
MKNNLGLLIDNFKKARSKFTVEVNNYEKLIVNQERGAWKLPSSISIHCGDFLTKCLKYKSEKRADWNELLEHSFLIEDTEFLERRGYDPTKYRQSIMLNINTSQNIVKNHEDELIKAIRFNLANAKAEEAAKAQFQNRLYSNNIG